MELVLIPAETQALLDDVYTLDGQKIWLRAINRFLDDQAPLDLIARGEVERVNTLLVALAEGVYL